MGRQASDKTTLANLRRELKEVRKNLSERSLSCDQYRRRASQAEQEREEWKKRFDQLLARTPSLPHVPLLPAMGMGVATLVNCTCVSGAEFSCQSSGCPRRLKPAASVSARGEQP